MRKITQVSVMHLFRRLVNPQQAVIPAQAGTRCCAALNPVLRRDDGFGYVRSKRYITKKIIAFLAFACALSPAFADDANPMFGDKTNQFGLYGGYAVADTAPEAAGGFMMLQYSQPSKIFRLNGRINLHGGLVASPDDQWLIAGASLDAVLFSWNRFYLGAGVGAYIRNKQTERLNSRFTFGERAFIGCRITDRLNTELYIQHFSNGDLTDKNLGYNFAGLSVNLNF